MKTQLSFANLAGITTELLTVLAVDTQTSKEADAKPTPVLLTSDEAVKSAAKAVLATGEYKAGAHETVLLHAPAGLAARRLLVVGLGKQPRPLRTWYALPPAQRSASPSRAAFVSWSSPCRRPSFCRPAPRPAPRWREPWWATSTLTPIAATART
jgi:hypothetical protein